MEGLVHLHSRFLWFGEGRQRPVEHVVKKVLPQLLLDIVAWLQMSIVLVQSGAPKGVVCSMAFDGVVCRSEEGRSIESRKSGDQTRSL